MWKLTIEDDQTNKTVVHLVRDDYDLGRAENNAVRLTERNISRHHARLEKNGKGWVLRDLTSYNGCYVNGQRVPESQELGHGDLIQVGDYRLTVESEGIAGADTVPTVPQPLVQNKNSDRLVMLMGPTPGAEFLLGSERILIGRGEDCAVSVNHPSVSRVHAELSPLGEGRYEIVDKASANGIRINGVELPRSLVDARDVIELGDVILKFIPAGDTYLAGSDDSRQLAAIGTSRRREAGEEALGTWWEAHRFKLIAGASAVALLGLLLLFALGRSARTTELVSAKDESSEQARSILAEARALLDDGDILGARDRVNDLPPGSPARNSGTFKSIQAAYADHLFEQAHQATDPMRKRALYDEIARSPTVDPVRRKRAADRLAIVGTEAVNVADLPSSPGDRDGAASAKVERPAPVREAPVEALALEPEGPRAPQAAKKAVSPAPKPKANPKPAPAELVRDNPFE